MIDPASTDELYDFAPEPSPAKAATRVPVVVAYVVPATLGYRAVKDDQAPPAEPETIKDVYLPLGILGGGIVVQVLASIIWTHQIAAALAELAVDLTLGTLVMLGAMLIAARLRGINLGKLHVAAYKLAAISIGPAAAVQCLEPIARYLPLGWMVCWIVEFVLFFALLGALFDLDESDTWYCVFTIFFTRVGSYLILGAIFHG